MKLNRLLVLLGTSLTLSFLLATSAQARKPPPPTDPPSGGGELTPQEQLGQLLFEDQTLSATGKQSCQSCHDPAAGFADPSFYDEDLEIIWPVSMGALETQDGQPIFGDRNAPSAGYTAFTPDFTTKRGIQGGQFWDGRANDLVEQAGGPFLNPVEMANESKADVIAKVQSGSYAEEFAAECSGKNVDALYLCLSEAIAAYESTSVFSPFASKFDAVQAGDGTVYSAEEAWGWDLFTGKAKCAHCHIAKVGAGSPILFTDFKYHNVGLPKNGYTDAGTDFGVGGVMGDPQLYGQFKDPHLRNVELTAPYMHNGVLQTLEQVVHFYNTRDVLPLCDPALGNLDPNFGTGELDECWAEPEFPDTMDSSFLGNLGLTDAEEAAIVAFLKTLTDAWDN